MTSSSCLQALINCTVYRASPYGNTPSIRGYGSGLVPTSTFPCMCHVGVTMSANLLGRSGDLMQHLCVQKNVSHNLASPKRPLVTPSSQVSQPADSLTTRNLRSACTPTDSRIALQTRQAAYRRNQNPSTQHQLFTLRASARSDTPELASTSKEPTLPESREAAIEQAQVAVTSALLDALTASEPALMKRRQKLKKARLQVEIPVLDDRPTTYVQLASDLLSGLFGAKTKLGLPQVVVYFGDAKTANLGAKETAAGGKLAGCQVASLASAIETPGTAGVSVIVNPSDKQLTLVQQLSVSAGLRPVVLVNPSWTVEGESKMSPVHVNLVNSFDVVYSFLPLSIQGFLNKSEGAVLKFVAGGSVSECPWYVFSMKDGKMQCVNKISKRPDAIELENALYQSIAASSPITRSVKAVRSIFGR